MDYDFSKLNDREFESLGASIIEKILSNKVEKFKSGKDGGVDGRFWISNKKEGIIQCKHYIETPYRQLVSKLKAIELDKVKNLNPGRYIFITSKPLSRVNKQEIKKLFNPYILHENDIFGGEDLQSFLAKKENRDIVEQHFKLWMTSTVVLDLIYNNALIGRSKSTLREIKHSTDKYVVTENHNSALKLLEKHNVVILTGEPGIGKTTLADNLSLHYLAKGYEFCDLEENFSEAEGVFRDQEKKKILFYCDDFLGSNLYDAINNKRDSHIVKFIGRVTRDNSKKFILTSRTNILNKAYSLSHRFQNDKIRDNEFLLRIENLTTIDKAQILYNHIYHSNLSEDYIDEIYKDKKYKKIIAHRNFNPRIIEFITDNERIGAIGAAKYWPNIHNNLENPEQIWSDYFQHQADDCTRALTFLTVYNKGQISEEALRMAYDKFLKIHNVNLGDYSDKSFAAVRKLALKSLLNRNLIDEDKFEYTLFNPSIADFVLNSYSEESELVSNLIKSLETETALDYFSSLTILKKINPKTSKKILSNLFDYFFENKMNEEDWDFLITLSYIDFFNPDLTDRIEYFLKTLVETEYATGHKLSELLSILIDFEAKIEFSSYKFLYGFIENIEYDDDLKMLLNFIDEYSIDDDYIMSKINIQLHKFLEAMFNNNELDVDYGEHISYEYYPEGYTDYDVDIDGIESDYHENFNSYLSDFNQNVIARIDFDFSGLISSYTIEDRARSYMENQGSDDGEYGSYSNTSSSSDDIDAIFER